MTGNLNGGKTRMIMANIIPRIEMMTKVICYFIPEFHQGAGEGVDYSKTLSSPPGIFTSFEEIQEYIVKCEQKRLNLENV